MMKTLHRLRRHVLGSFIGVVGPLLITSSSAQAACKLGVLAELPVRISASRAIILARINGEDVPFLADSGAFYSIISPGAASMLHLPLSPMPSGYEVNIGGQRVTDVATAKVFSVSAFFLKNLQFMLSKSEIDIDADGRIGLNILGTGDTEYDFSNSIIRLMSANDCGNTNFAYWAKDKPYAIVQTEPGDSLHPQPTAVAFVNNIKVHVIFDTSFERSMLSLSALQKLKLKPDDGGANATNPKLITRPNNNQSVFIKELSLGEEKVGNTRLLVGRFVHDADMVLGMDFFLSHRIFVANSQHRIYLSYESGPVFVSKHPAAQGGDHPAVPGGDVGAEGAKPQSESQLAWDFGSAPGEGLAPDDADGLSRQGAFFAARHEYDKAIADLSRVRELAPDNPDYAYELATVLIAAHRKASAGADLDEAIKLKPNDTKALLLRALLRRADKDQSGELSDLDALSHNLLTASNLRLTLANLYSAAGEHDAAIEQFNDWLDSHPEDSRRPLALNGRCWARAQAGRELDKALSDCNHALWLDREASFFDSRGLVRLRRGEFDQSISDYDHALKLNPKIAWSLYGRGLAELKTGNLDKGRGDVGAAVALAPKLPQQAAKIGLSPEAFTPASAASATSSTAPAASARLGFTTSNAATPSAAPLNTGQAASH